MNIQEATPIELTEPRAEDTTILAVERTLAELARVCFSDVRKLQLAPRERGMSLTNTKLPKK
jgi:hypothetical protein